MRPPGILMGLPSPGLRMILLQGQALVQVMFRVESRGGAGEYSTVNETTWYTNGTTITWAQNDTSTGTGTSTGNV